ncbi:aspartate ammonia-lyase [Psychromonas sp. SR45-3]|uniref:aspartate ammonia-lyase n=1 Tax=Psychromonas sp. SR45-3 TaxID=2760930 RepID=UPI0015F8A0F7|nr:aspartate ammonia-lyase [Psychromonas sp. SR45-3]MBB1271361.1 aspartate ammonia-lyase [Psychromonas sp. SR45-3]
MSKKQISKVQSIDAPKERIEKDLLGERSLPKEVYYGVQTLRAMENFNITSICVGDFPNLVKALGMVKKACAIANAKLNLLENEKAEAITKACDEVISGKFNNQFVVDMIQGGAGTSTNMNANEVIANRALEILGHEKGRYEIISPNNHVNLSQSTNDVYPTALRLALIMSTPELYESIASLGYQCKQKAVEFSRVIKMGRTQLQDAVPMTLGQEFEAYYATLKEDLDMLKAVSNNFKEINLGATAIGTGINTDPEYSSLVIEELCWISDIHFVRATNLIEATSDMGAFVTLSSMLKRTAIKVSKICNDLRLMSSGPRAGLNEINLPAMQPGSSIMPGKVNPVIPEVVNQVAYQVIGNDLAITMAAEAGQLQLNVMEPVIAFNLLRSIKFLSNAFNTLAIRCISGITANEEHCKSMVYNSIGIVTAINPYLGYEESTRIAKEALATGENIINLIKRDGLLTDLQLADILNPENMTQPRRQFSFEKKS